MSGNLFENEKAKIWTADGWFTAHCDGGSRGNPGPAGYGAVIEDPQGQLVARLSEFLGRQTNNYAEYKGLLAVLAWALWEEAQHQARQLDAFEMRHTLRGGNKEADMLANKAMDQGSKRPSE